MKTTTTEDFEIFKKEVNYWVEYFGLYHWDITVLHKKPTDIDIYFAKEAWVDINSTDYIATIYLNKELSSECKKTEMFIKRLAFHEVCEILLSPLSELALEKYNVLFVRNKSHFVINLLENRVFKKSREVELCGE